MTNRTVETFWTRLERNASGADTEVEYQVVAEYYPGEVASFSSHPEKGAPPEPAEVDVTDVYEITAGAPPRVVDLEDFLDSLNDEEGKDLVGRLLLKGEDDARFEREERRHDDHQNRICEARSYNVSEED